MNRIAIALCFLVILLYAGQTTRNASLKVTILDAATSQRTAARVLLEDAHGNRPEVSGALTLSESNVPIPEGAVPVMWGRSDRAEGYMLQRDGAFYADGGFSAELPAGAYKVTIGKGLEYVPRVETFTAKAGEPVERTVRLERWIDMPARGWYSADDHVHLQRSLRDDPYIAKWMAAEDVHVGNLLEMGDFFATYFSQYSFGDKGRYREGDYILSPGQEEPRTPEIGHTISLGHEQLVRFRDDYYSYGRLFDRVHELGGISGFAHQGFSFHGYRGMTLNVLRKKVDFLELLQLCVPEGPLAVDHYYHFLDLGFRLTALAGSDFPWCGRGPRYGFGQDLPQIGNARFYTYVGGPLTFGAWFEAVKAGRTFGTTGPMVLLRVNDKLPGDTIDVPRGTTLKITAEAYGHKELVPLRSLEIIGHGRVIEKATGSGADHLTASLELPADHGIWIAARCDAGKTQSAHTTPVYVAVDGGRFQNPERFQERLDLSERYLQELEQALDNPEDGLDRQATRHRAKLEEQIAEARQVLREMAGGR